jgi:aminoacyl tRNA synthase complex-interacting multifunctional protein 1
MASSGKATYTASQQLEILSWQSLALTSPAAVQRLELFLQTSHRSFLCSFQRFSLADSAVASAIIANEALLSAAAALPEVRRWLRTILSLMKEPLPKVLVPSIEATLLPIPAPVGTATATATAAAAAAAAATSAPTSILEKTVAKVSEKKAKATPPTAFATTAPAANEEGEESLDPSKLDLRVGLITKCWNHPEAEKLLCEEVDLAEPTGPRSIASGLRAHYSAEAMVGKKVIVVANLKEAKLVGFKSNGMVLCACTADKSSVKLLEAPADATVGERVVFEGFSGEAASSSVMAKKKVLEKLAPGVIYNSWF